MLNEPFCTYRYTSSYSSDELHSLLWDIYNNAYNVIRSTDQNHVVNMESVWDAQDLPKPLAANRDSYGGAWEAFTITQIK